MNNNSLARRKTVSPVWPAALLVPAGAGGLWWGLVRGDVPGLLAVAALALLFVLAVAGFLRAREARRRRAAMNAYAEREIARAPRRRASRAGV